MRNKCRGGFSSLRIITERNAEDGRVASFKDKIISNCAQPNGSRLYVPLEILLFTLVLIKRNWEFRYHGRIPRL